MAAVYWGADRLNTTTRAIAGFKDGVYIRRVEVGKNKNGNQCRVVVKSVEDVQLHEQDLEDIDSRFANFYISSIQVLLSSFDGTVCLVIGGFDSGSQHATGCVVKLDYKAAPEVRWEQQPLPGM